MLDTGVFLYSKSISWKKHASNVGVHLRRTIPKKYTVQIIATENIGTSTTKKTNNTKLMNCQEKLSY